MGDVPVTRGEALVAVGVGLAVMTVGLVAVFGPWPLVVVGLVVVMVALVVPTAETSTTPTTTQESDEEDTGP